MATVLQRLVAAAYIKISKTLVHINTAKTVSKQAAFLSVNANKNVLKDIVPLHKSNSNNNIQTNSINNSVITRETGQTSKFKIAFTEIEDKRNSTMWLLAVTYYRQFPTLVRDQSA